MEIESRIKAIIADQLGVDVDKLTPEKELMADLNATNLEITDLMLVLEKNLRIPIPADTNFTKPALSPTVF